MPQHPSKSFSMAMVDPQGDVNSENYTSTISDSNSMGLLPQTRAVHIMPFHLYNPIKNST